MLAYPWQWLSAVTGLRLQFEIPCSIDLERLQAELDEVNQYYRAKAQDGPYHNGNWKRLGLVAPEGDPFLTHLKYGQSRRPTPVLELMPSVQKLMDDMASPVRNAYISVMEPGAHVRWYRDRAHSIDLATARLHVPILTAPSSILRIGHEVVHWSAGKLWYADFSFPHSVDNGWDRPRVHIILDIEATDALRAAFPPDHMAAAPLRNTVRKAVARMFDFSEKLHPEGRKAIQARAKRQIERDRASGDQQHEGVPAD